MKFGGLHASLGAAVFAVSASTASISEESEILVIGGEGATCLDDPACINRFHPDIPMIATAQPGQPILFRTRDAGDILGTVANQPNSLPQNPPVDFSRIHPVTGPVHIEGAAAGDVLAVTIKDITPGNYAWTSAGSYGFAADLIGGADEVMVTWDLNDGYATSPDLPGIKIPNAGFPGIIATLPNSEGLKRTLHREHKLAEAGGIVSLPDSTNASPDVICGPQSSKKEECLRTIPPREHGGNMDIRYLKKGVTVYLPCNIDGCGLAIGDLHFAQGDGEIGGSAIEMSADVLVSTKVLKEGPDLTRGPHYSGGAELLDIPSGSFYAVTGLPIKKETDVPPDMSYLNSTTVKTLENLSNDINLSARNAVDGIIDYIVGTYGYTRQQAYIIASVAVDIRISQLVDAPNVGVTAILPLDIFEKQAGH